LADLAEIFGFRHGYYQLSVPEASQP